ncbi:contractile injection system protein, VgrG/Pvc8 family [Novosphingopyxis sp. YJ-S2-01]|uniref:contractile injection system protein, VgrG/Pvc8 family n=1 Tax=Novosphingopyxis sp. YJ-S2-01 TaxID=2794021 RepID=UPI0018DC5AA1|nr:contractile injection system protein, VgrG/Pvc8 family [Novosphingopyxis sp. YJ-S2-01]MBH9537913.1 phage late control D family protein [Novosphingopyxis sp. YJ-S2-01]
MQPIARPAWRIALDGRDLSDRLRPYLMSIALQERREDAADQLTVDLDDSAGDLALPPVGATIQVQLGFEGQDGGVAAGLFDKGLFTVDEVTHSGPPDRITLRARSADFTSSWRMRRDQSWQDVTLGAVLQELAGRQEIKARIAAALASRQFATLVQSRESDLAFLRRLGKENDAVATVKNGTLLFLPLAGGQTAGGESLPPVRIAYRDGDGHDYRIAAREEYSGVTAKWHDKQAAKEKTVKARAAKAKAEPEEAPSVTTGDAENPKVLHKIFASEEEAQRAADAEWARIRRAPRSLSVNLAFGRPEIGAEQPVTLTGFRAEITAENWIVASVAHNLDPRSGLTTRLECEVPIAGAGSIG